MIRLAYFSPLNPIPSGISDYSEELLPLLVRNLRGEFEIELVVDGFALGNKLPTNPVLRELPIRTLREFAAHAREFDLALYHMGNSPAHANIYQALLEFPGVVVLHDLVLHHLRAWQTIDRGDAKSYIEAMRAAYGPAGAELATLEARGQAGLNRFDYPLHHDVVRAARALIVHSEYAAREVQPIVPATPIAVVPMGVPPMPQIPTREARSRLQLPPDAFIVAAFGEVHPHKRVTIALEAFADFRASVPNSLFLLIGRESPNYDVGAILSMLRLQDAVRRIGFAPSGQYEHYIAAADVCLNLRYPSAGETSASLLRLFSAGKAVIVTRTGSYAELPDSVCAKIEPDEYEQELLRAHLELFAERPDLVAALGANARDFVEHCHTLEQSAAAYADFLRAVVDGRAESKSYLRNWIADSRRPTTATLLAPPLAGGAQFASPPRAKGGVVAHSAPPLPPDELRDSLARDYAELGFEADDPVLRDLVRAMVELGITGEERR